MLVPPSLPRGKSCSNTRRKSLRDLESPVCCPPSALETQPSFLKKGVQPPSHTFNHHGEAVSLPGIIHRYHVLELKPQLKIPDISNGGVSPQRDLIWNPSKLQNIKPSAGLRAEAYWVHRPPATLCAIPSIFRCSLGVQS